MRYNNSGNPSSPQPVPPPIVRVWESRPQAATPVNEQPTQYWSPDMASAPAAQVTPDRFWRRFIVVMFLVAFLALGGAVVSTYALFDQSQTIFPAVSAVGVNLGGLTQAEAEVALTQVVQTANIQVLAGQTLRPISLAELGYALDTPAIAAEAYQRGRIRSEWRELPLAFLLGLEVSPRWQFRETIAYATLIALASEAYQPPIPPDLIYASGQVQMTPGQPGSKLDVNAALVWLGQQSPATLAGQTITLPMLPEEPDMAGAQAQVAAANQHLSQTLTVSAYDAILDEHLTWRIPPAIWNQWVMARRVSDTPTGFVFSLASNAVQDYFLLQEGNLAATQYLKASDAAATLLAAYDNGQWETTIRIYHPEREHVVQSGETLSSIAEAYGLPYPWLEQANPGLSGLYPGQSIMVPSADVFLPLPVIENKRIIISINEQKMWAYEDGILKWEWAVSTGIAESPTSSGVYQIQTHVDNAYAGNWDLWMPYFMGIYRPVPTSDFMNGFHGFPTRGSSQLLWTNSLGHPVTYGCVLVSNDNAAALYSWAEEGTVVEIQP